MSFTFQRSVVFNSLLPSLFLGVLVLASGAQASDVACQQIFTKPVAVKSISHYLKQVEAAEAQKNIQPRFIDPSEEKALVPKWQGTQEVPEAIRNTLLSNAAVIDYQLIAPDAGVVKMAQPGSLTSFRLNHSWEGKNMSTNVGMPIDAILARSLRANQSEKLVTEDTKAVFIFMHGGGTRTTGHHVAANLANYLAHYGVVVISIDAPFHAFGPREENLTPQDYYRYLEHFRNTYIPENVDTFIGGHSMGGLHADNLMRLSGEPTSTLRKSFAGLVNLSGPIDSAPGKTPEEKFQAEETVSNNAELMELVPEAERDLMVLLLTQGKGAPLSGLSAESFIVSANWEMPEHQGANYLPALAVMGERDALYVGREGIFEDYISNLENTEAHVIGQRPNFKGQTDWVGHMIFDHYHPDNFDEPETFSLIRGFIEKQIGEPLEQGGIEVAPGLNRSSLGLVSKVIQEYYNNLAFRYFAQQYSVLTKSATDQLSELGQQSSQLAKEGKSLEREIKTLRRSEPESEALTEKEERYASIQSQLAAARNRQQSYYVPNDSELSPLAQANVDRRKRIQELTNEITSEKKSLSTELAQIREHMNKNLKNLKQAVEDQLENLTLSTPAVNQAKSHFESVLDQMLEVQERMNNKNREQVLQNFLNGTLYVNPNEQAVSIYRELDQAYRRYNIAERKLRHSIEQAIAQGHLGETAQSWVLELYGSSEAHQAQQPLGESLRGRLQSLSEKVEKLEMESSRLNTESNELLLEYIYSVTPELYSARMTTLAQELQRPLPELIGNISSLERLWKVWLEIWRERPPEQSTSLY